MKKIFNLKKYLFLFLLPLTVTLNYISSFYSTNVENLYSTKIYPIIAKVISFIPRFVPISLGELIVIISIISIIIYILFSIYKIISSIIKKNNKSLYNLKRFIFISLNIFSIVYFIFIISWGLNYHREPFSKIANLDVKKSSIEELEDLANNLLIKANDLRSNLTEDTKGVMTISEGYKEIFKSVQSGYNVASIAVPELKGYYSNPKGVILSEGLSYMGISGIYFPFTSEANVNISMPYSMIPVTAAHEMAHQRGFAREDEANYIAYLTCSLHPDDEFKYSGTLLGLIYSMNKLYEYAPEKHKALSSKYSLGVKRDLKAISEYWRKYEGPVEKASSKLNNTYLKSNMVEDGVHSYGRMLDLLLAERRKIKALESNN